MMFMLWYNTLFIAFRYFKYRILIAAKILKNYFYFNLYWSVTLRENEADIFKL